MRSTLVLMALAGHAAAQPVTRPERDCKVTIALAPADVRAEIEAWVHSEPRCEHELEVRVVPTKAGYYISARDERGRVRERVVPDAQSAAVLVVSWMADDSLGPLFPTPVEDRAPDVATLEPLASERPSPISAPSIRRGFRIERVERAQRWFSVGAAGSSADRIGVRGQIDVISGRSWNVAVAGGWRAGDRGPDVSQARLLVGTQRSFGRLSLRAQLGFGADVVEDGRDQMPFPGGERSSVIGKAEAGVLAGLRLDRTWGLIGGPLVESSPELRPTLSVYLGLVRGL